MIAAAGLAIASACTIMAAGVCWIRWLHGDRDRNRALYGVSALLFLFATGCILYGMGHIDEPSSAAESRSADNVTAPAEAPAP